MCKDSPYSINTTAGIIQLTKGNYLTLMRKKKSIQKEQNLDAKRRKNIKSKTKNQKKICFSQA